MPKGARKVGVSFEETHITHFGGMWLIQRFCNKLGLRYLLQKHISFGQRDSDCHPTELILALLYAIIRGLRRINKTEILQYNGAFLEMSGLERFPDQSTLRRFLKRLPIKTIRQLGRLHDGLRAHLFGLPQVPSSLVFDIDSVVITIYGKPEGARVGYNPKKHGRRFYHPIFCFEATRREFWHGMFRPGNAGAATGAWGFIQACLDKAPSSIAHSRIRFRMDSGFYGRPVIEFLDGAGCVYVIVAKEYPTIKHRARSCRFRAFLRMMEEFVVREEREPRRRVFDQLLRNNRFLKWCPRLYAVIFILFMLTFFSAIIFWIASLTPFGERIVSTLSRQLTQVHGEERLATARA